MKKVMLFFFIGLSISGFAQSFTTTWTENNITKFVHISVDTNFSQIGISVDKEFVESIQGTILENGELLLIGDFVASGNNYIIDYDVYKYYLILFNPQTPIIILNNSKPTNISEGTLFLSNALGISGDITYWCSCGIHNVETSDPGGCLSSVVNGPIKILICIKDGNDCTE